MGVLRFVLCCAGQCEKLSDNSACFKVYFISPPSCIVLLTQMKIENGYSTLLTGWSATTPHPPVTTILPSRTARTTQQQHQQFRDHGITRRLDTLPPAGLSPGQGTSSPSATRLGLSRITVSFVRGTTLPPPSRPTSPQHSRYQNNMNDKQLTSHMPTSTLSDLGNTIEPANPTQGTPPWTAEIYPCTHISQKPRLPYPASFLLPSHLPIYF